MWENDTHPYIPFTVNTQRWMMRMRQLQSTQMQQKKDVYNWTVYYTLMRWPNVYSSVRQNANCMISIAQNAIALSLESDKSVSEVVIRRHDNTVSIWNFDFEMLDNDLLSIEVFDDDFEKQAAITMLDDLREKPSEYSIFETVAQWCDTPLFQNFRKRQDVMKILQDRLQMIALESLARDEATRSIIDVYIQAKGPLKKEEIGEHFINIRELYRMQQSSPVDPLNTYGDTDA